MSCLQESPSNELVAINTIDVGVATFSLILNRIHKIENEQMSNPLPIHAVNIPPITPTNYCEYLYEIIVFCYWSNNYQTSS